MDSFNGIYIDYPANERGAGKSVRGCQRHYEPIKTKERVIEVIHGSGVWRPNEDCHLYLWATNNHFEDAFWIMRALGFRPHTQFPWIKDGPIGLGQYARGKHETILFGTRGCGYAVKTNRNDIATDYLVHAPSPLDMKTGKRLHSAKPWRAYELIEARTVGPWLEMFHAGEVFHRDGWTQWGPENHRPIEAIEAVVAVTDPDLQKWMADGARIRVQP